jgi:hypothetical protein
MAPDSDWKHLAEQASTETNGDNLMKLVTELNRVLVIREEATRQRQADHQL